MASEQILAALQLLKMEAESSFGAENGAHSFFDIRAIEPDLTRGRTVHERAERIQRLTMKQGLVLGALRDSRLAFRHYLVGDGVALDTAATATDDSLQLLLETCLGGGYAAAGSTILGAGATTTVLPVQVGHGTRFKPGTAILVEGTGAGGVNEQSVIASVAGDSITLEYALSNAPADTKKVWNSYTSYIDPSATATLQAQLVAEGTADTWLALGIVGGLQLQNLLQLEDVAQIAFDLQIAKWESDTATIAAGSYDGADPLATDTDIEIHYQTHGTTTRNLISLSQLDVDPGVIWTPLYARGNADKEHIARFKMTGIRPALTMTGDIDSAHETTFSGQTYKMIAIMFGRTAGSSWCVCMPRARISQQPARAVHAEQTATSLSFLGHENDADSSTARGRSPLFISRI